METKKVLIRFLWQLMQLHVIKTFSCNVWKYKNGTTGLDLHRSPRYSQTSPGFPFRVHCQGHASPPWCRRCHSSTSCTHRRCWAAAPKKFRQFRVSQRHSVLKRAKSLKAEILWSEMSSFSRSAPLASGYRQLKTSGRSVSTATLWSCSDFDLLDLNPSIQSWSWS